MIELKRPHESYNDSLSLTIRLLQIIEKYKLKTRYGKVASFPVDDLKEHNSYKQSGNIVMAIELPMTKEEIRTGKNFETSSLKELLGIDSIFEDLTTEVVSVEMRGEDYRAERFKIVTKLGDISFDLVGQENFDMSGYNHRQKENYFTFDKNGRREQIVLFIRFDPCLMLLNDTKLNYFIEDVSDATRIHFDIPMDIKDSTLGYIDHLKKVRSNAFPYIIIAYSLYNLYELSKHNEFGLDGSFLDLVGFDPKEAGFNHNDLMYVNGVVFKTTQDLSQPNIDIMLLDLVKFQFAHSTIPSQLNNINPINTNTYSKFLFTKDNKPQSLSAFDIIPETQKAPDLLEIKKKIPGSNKFQVIRTSLFLPKDSHIDKMLADYDRWIIANNTKNKIRWQRIVDRIERNNPEGLGFVNRIYLSLLYIKKYMRSDYRYNHQESNSNINKVPPIFKYLNDTMGIDPSSFFGITGYEGYFNDMGKASAVISQLDLHNNRYSAVGNLKDTHMSGYGVSSSLYFTNQLVMAPEPKNGIRQRYNPNIHLIINDSYTKQAWRPKIKSYINNLVGVKKDSLIFILTTNNKLETMLLKRVLKDRGMVHCFSDFTDTVTVKRNVNTRRIKIMVITPHNYHDIRKRKNWHLNSKIEAGTFDNNLLVPYSAKNGFMFNGKYNTLTDNQDAWRKWQLIMKNDFKMNIVFISEKDLTRLKKDFEVPTLEKFFQSDTFKEKIKSIANKELLVNNVTESNLLKNFVVTMQNHFLDVIYSSQNIPSSRLAEQVFHRFIQEIRTPELRDALVKIMPYFQSLKSLTNRYYNRYAFPSFITHLPEKITFDYDIFQEISKERATTFSIDEIKAVSDFNETYHSRGGTRTIHISIGALKNLINDLPSLLQKSNDLNLNKEEHDIILNSRVNLYILDFLKLVEIT